MLDVTVRRPVAPDDAAVLRYLAERAERADGHASLGDSVWRDLADPASTSSVAFARTGGEVVGALHAAPPENDASGALTLAMVVDPDHRNDGVERALLHAVRDDPSVKRHGALLWIFGAGARADRLAADTGLVPVRALQQMRAALPRPSPRWPSGVEVGPLRVGVDEDAWLVVNNRAFAGDPDQSGWTLDAIRRREVEPWFDPAGFLLAWRGTVLAGFCWTKLHEPAPPVEPDRLGEIYVIGVDPDHQGIGLGRALVLAGLEWMHDHGAAVGMLFVDAANAAAVSLYESLGFTTARVDRAYSLAPA